MFDRKTLETYTTTLERVAANYEKNSSEYFALKLASKALIYTTIDPLNKFGDFLASCDEELSDEQRQHLRNLGIEGV
jgi:hypothetical protein